MPSPLPSGQGYDALAGAGPVRIGWRTIRPGDENLLLPSERAALGASAPTVWRRSGAARALARDLLRQEGVPPGPILRSAGGPPVWPDGIAGSLAHDDEVALAAIVRSGPVRAVGIDVEPDLPLPDGTACMVATPSEADRYGTEFLQARILFSVKEAAYKAFCAVDGRFLDFGEIETALETGMARSVHGLTADVRWIRTPRVVALATVRRSP